jgi:Icc-related predicted phosphoesterase
MKYKILYTADLHGNEEQFQKLANYSKKESSDAVIIGGDIAPKNFSTDNHIKEQRDFLEKKLPYFLDPISAKSRLFLIMGNDDYSCNLDVLKKQEKIGLFELIHNKRRKIGKSITKNLLNPIMGKKMGKLDLVGYNFVSITRFSLKDWEKYDLSDVPEKYVRDYEELKKEYILHGIKSTKQGLREFNFPDRVEETDSIQKDLFTDFFTKNVKNTVYVIHCPPYGTKLDKTLRGSVGSIAVRQFIEKYEPYLTLHGHVHETVKLTGRYTEEIGKTVCISAGNSDRTKELAVIVFDLYNPREAERKII